MGVTLVPFSIVAGVGCGAQNWQFYAVLEYKCPMGAYPYGDFRFL